MSNTVYLLHFNQKLHHAGHYLGWCDDLEARLKRHRAGQGAKLLQAIAQVGIEFEVARTWDGDRTLERQLKRRKASPRLCPLCKQDV